MISFMKNFIFCAGFIFASASYAELKFEGAKIFAPLKGSNATAAYVVIKNNSTEAIEISLNKVEKFKKAETHETTEKDGRMSMQKVEYFKILPNAEIQLKPGGKHIMLFDPIGEIKLNSNLKVHFIVNKKPMIIYFKVISRVEEMNL
jgi:periplasmic copper chaperone A